MRMLLLFGSLALLAGGGAAAKSAIDIERSVFVETTERQAGKVVRELQPASTLRKGDSVVLMLEWTAPGRKDSFTVSSRVPRDLAFQRSGGHAPQVSVDSGKTWGSLASMQIGPRRASPEDVTHLRWQVSDAEAALGRGILSYSAIVR